MKIKQKFIKNKSVFLNESDWDVSLLSSFFKGLNKGSE